MPHAETERIQAYSEAVFSIVATLMAVPLYYDDERADEFDGFYDYLGGQDMTRRYLVFFVSFFIVIMWRALHIRVFRTLAHVPRRIVYLNNCFLFLTAVLPLTSFTERVKYLAALSVLLCLVTHAMWRLMLREPMLVHPEVRAVTAVDLVRMGAHTSLSPLPGALGVLLLATTTPEEFWEAAALPVFVLTFVFVVWRCARRMREMPRELVTPARDEAFGDGVMAISGTLSLVDASAGYVNHTLSERELATQVLAFTLAFSVISMLWHSNHVILHLVRVQRMAYSALNYVLLFCVALLPFASSVLSNALRPAFPTADATASAVLFLLICFVGTAAHAMICVELYRNVVGAISPARAVKYRISVVRATLLPLACVLTMPLTILSPWCILALFVVVPALFAAEHAWERASGAPNVLSPALLPEQLDQDAEIVKEVEEAHVQDVWAEAAVRAAERRAAEAEKELVQARRDIDAQRNRIESLAAELSLLKLSRAA